AELLDAHRCDRDLRRAAQQVVQADPEQAREALVDHFERGHAPTHNAHLVLEVVLTHLARARRGLGVDGAAVDPVDEGVDLILVENFFGAHCITKLVKYTASTFSGLPPALVTILRTAASVCCRSASLPSRVEMTAYFWPANNISRSLRTIGSLVFSSSMDA